MKLPELFRAHLLSKRSLSEVTAKNYTSDIRKFISWFETSFGKTFQSRDLTPDVITLFQKTRGEIINTNNPIKTLPISNRSLERYLSSLRKLASFLSEEGYIDENPFDNLTAKSPTAKTDPWFLKDFKNYLYVYGASNMTIKNYLVDINAFTKWLEDILKTYLNISNPNINNINPGLIEDYKQRLILVLKVSPKTVNRKLSSIRKYLEFAASQGHINQEYQISNIKYPISKETLKLEDIEQQEENGQWSKIPPIRLLQNLLIPYVLLEDLIARQIAQVIKHKKLSRKASISQGLEIKNIPAHIPFHEKLIHHAKYTRPNWYKIYHKYTFTHYFHLAILIIYASIIGFILYTNLFTEPRESAFAGPIAPKRVLSFQGRLTDASDNPIIAATDIRFGIYESQTATGSALLWQEVHSAVTPDSDGIFSILLGTKDGIPSSVFRDHDLIWLGITIGKTPELTPRQRVAAVAYAANSESLQGMLPVTDSAASTTNVVLALDSSGNLTMGGTAAPTFAATGGRFRLSGTILLLSTQSSSNGDIDISPDGIGKIDVHKPIINDTITGNLIGGAVEINDKVAVLATESAVAAFVINNNTTGGDIIAASSSGTTRLTLSNLGVLSFVGGQTADLTSLSNANLTVSAGGSGDLRFLSDSDTDIILTNFTGNNSALYATASTGVLAGATTSTANLCLVSGASAPSWASCESGEIDAFWNQSSGLLFPNNSTVDLSIGAQSTASAKFAFINVDSGTPTATISANSGNNATYLSGAGTLSTVNMQTLTVGSSTTGNIVIDSGSSSITLSDKLTLSSNITESNTGQYLCVNTTSFEVGRNNTACSASSARFKENINDLSYGLADVMNLRPVTFIFKGEMNLGNDLQVGFIAEEVEKVIPELVSYDSQGRPSGVNYPNMTALLTRAVQELDLKNQELAAQVVFLGQSLRDYIVAVVSEAGFINKESEIVSGLTSVDRVHTNVISPLADSSDISVSFHDSRFLIHDSATSSGSVVASIDNQGNATFSGQLSASSVQSEKASISGELAAENLTANNASVSGTLYADKIVANSIEGLEARIATIAASYVKPLSGDEARFVASSSATLPGDLTDTGFLTLTDQRLDTDFVDIQNLSVDFATFRGGLIALGPTTLTQATVLDSLSIGTSFIIGPNSIDTLGQTLEIQPLRQGLISFMAGAVRIETDGTLKVIGNAEFSGDLKIEGELSANIISPLSDNPLVIARTMESTEIISTNSALLTQASLLDVQGSASISGILTSHKLNLAFAEQAFATSDIEAVATGSAGTATLKQYRKELTIKNPTVTEKSLIYITPVGNTNNKVLYLLRQVPEDVSIAETEGSFTVGINQASTATDIKFNWIIVN